MAVPSNSLVWLSILDQMYGSYELLDPICALRKGMDTC